MKKKGGKAIPESTAAPPPYFSQPWDYKETWFPAKRLGQSLPTLGKISQEPCLDPGQSLDFYPGDSTTWHSRGAAGRRRKIFLFLGPHRTSLGLRWSVLAFDYERVMKRTCSQSLWSRHTSRFPTWVLMGCGESPRTHAWDGSWSQSSTTCDPFRLCATGRDAPGFMRIYEVWQGHIGNLFGCEKQKRSSETIKHWYTNMLFCIIVQVNPFAMS